jgi:hypothetical protein
VPPGRLAAANVEQRRCSPLFAIGPAIRTGFAATGLIGQRRRSQIFQDNFYLVGVTTCEIQGLDSGLAADEDDVCKLLMP